MEIMTKHDFDQPPWHDIQEDGSNKMTGGALTSLLLLSFGRRVPTHCIFMLMHAAEILLQISETRWTNCCFFSPSKAGQNSKQTYIRTRCPTYRIVAWLSSMSSVIDIRPKVYDPIWTPRNILFKSHLIGYNSYNSESRKDFDLSSGVLSPSITLRTLSVEHHGSFWSSSAQQDCSERT